MVANPFDTGLLAVTAAQNPSVAADALSLIGDPGMPGPLGDLFGGASLGQFIGQGNPLIPQAGGVAGGFGGGQLPTGLTQGFGGGFQPPLAANLGIGGPQVAGAGGELAGDQAGQSPLSGLQGFKGPEKVKPQFSGGIAGAQRAPGQQIGGLSTAPILQVLQQLLGPGAGGAGPPNLGSLLGGR